MSSSRKVLLIAEAGVNHRGSVDDARAMIKVAAQSGADYVKFQTFDAAMLTTKAAPKAPYQVTTTGESESQFDMLSNLEISRASHETLLKECRKHQIGFASTGFSTSDLDFLVDLGVDFIKIPSGEISNLPYLRHVARLRRPVILSTGMSSLSEVEMAVSILVKDGMTTDDLCLLHCTSEYPAPFDQVNLTAIQTLKNEFGTKVGYSDHTLGIEASIAAVALGAEVIEKHFTLNKAWVGPDHHASLDPSELCKLNESIRNIERAIGDGVKRPMQCERLNMVAGRRSIVAARKINKGEIISIDSIEVKRPGHGLSPMKWDEVVGSVAKQDFAVDDLIKI